MSTAPAFHVDVAAFSEDPYPILAEMRAEAPICFVPELGATLLTKRDHIHACERNVAVFSSEPSGGLMGELMGAHREERFVYYPAISPNAVKARWAEQFVELTDRVLDNLAPKGSADLVVDYATAVSGEALKVMTGLTNITYEEMDLWSQAMIDGITNYTGDPEIEGRCRAATAAIDEAIDERLANPDDESAHSLLAVMVQSGKPIDKVRANIKLTISGGQNEPRDAIAGGIWALLTHPDQLDAVREGEVSWQDAFEEYCRWVAPIGMAPRRVVTGHEFEGVEFEAEDEVFLMFGSANRDEAHFDRADEFDVERDNRMALTFGAGPHRCAGAAASRSLVGDVALPRAFNRLADVQIDDTAQPVSFVGWEFRGPVNVPTTWTTP